jgi:hypothetical protein
MGSERPPGEIVPPSCKRAGRRPIPAPEPKRIGMYEAPPDDLGDEDLLRMRRRFV